MAVVAAVRGSVATSLLRDANQGSLNEAVVVQPRLVLLRFEIEERAQENTPPFVKSQYKYEQTKFAGDVWRSLRPSTVV